MLQGRRYRCFTRGILGQGTTEPALLRIKPRHQGAPGGRTGNGSCLVISELDTLIPELVEIGHERTQKPCCVFDALWELTRETKFVNQQKQDVGLGALHFGCGMGSQRLRGITCFDFAAKRLKQLR